MSNEKKFETIKSMFNLVLEDGRIRIFPLERNGQSYAANKKTKKSARISISIPKEICDENLQDLRNWKMFVVAIPNKVIDEL